mmetsp:Transcript_73229/g.160260  ORF Transcript_73229/g.160260 Transcript_73229/m.160260 type:complete len:1329 (+) Transcript_73229:229-4215(+)
MAPLRAVLTLAAVNSVTAATRGQYVPFSDLDSLRPQRLHQFCEDESFANMEGHGNVRRCSHNVVEDLEDGGRIELGWQMHADPDRILSLDTEAELGVELLECAPTLLKLAVPHSHVHHLQEQRLIVGSRFVHGCDHLGDRHLYHRIRNVLSHEESGDRHHMAVETEELSSIAHAIPKWDLQFSWMPAEALDEDPFPEMKTDYGLNRPHLEEKKRRLFGLDDITKSLKSLGTQEGVEQDAGGFRSEHDGSQTFDTQNGLLNFMPKQLSNFGWNWDFFMNTTQEPDFYMDIPGARGVLHVRKPYIKVHSGIYLNFSSHFGSLTQPPKVMWTFGLKGKGHVQARCLGSMNTTEDAGEDPFRAFKLDMFKEFESPKWFSKIDVVSGNMPVTMEPGFQMSATMYHRGTFHGAVGFGGRTQGMIHPSLTYDSDKGFESNFHGNLTNTSYWPPIWIIFTKQFEMGVILKPSILMKGDFAGMERATMAIEGRPYMNISIVREGSGVGGSAGSLGYADSSNKTLVAYPMRIMGLKSGDFNKKYKVKVVVNGKMIETSAQPQWGEVTFRDHVSNFEIGSISESDLLDPQTIVHLTVFEIDTNSAIPTTTTLGTGQTSCKSLQDGICVLSPSDVVVLNSAGLSVASVQLALIWKDDAKSWFATQIKGMSLAFSQAIIRQEALMKGMAAGASYSVGAEAQNVALHMVAGGRTSVIPLKGKLESGQTSMSGTSTLELSPSFVQTWQECSMASDDCVAPRLELWANNQKVAVGSIPQANLADSRAQAFLAAESDEAVAMPVSVSLHAIGSEDLTMALVTMKMKILDTLKSSLFLAPSLSTGEVKWMITEVDPKHTYTFNLQAYTTQPAATADPASLASYSQVNGDILTPVGAPEKFELICTPLTSAGLESQTPCVFAAAYSFEGLHIPAGATATLELTWTDKDGVQHVLFSPPVQMSDTLLPRQLQEGHLEERRLFSREAWNARIDQHSGCKERELKFNLGTGLKVRGRIEGLDMPKGFPQIGTSDSQPGISTGFKTVFQEHPGKEADDALGGDNGLLCQLGLCQGVLPGCSKGGTKAEHFPSLIFNVNRPMHFQETKRGSFEGMMKEALAYAFSALPEAVDLAVREINTTHLTHKIHKATTAPPNWWDTPSTTKAPNDWPSQPVAPAPAPAPQKSDDDTVDAFKEWWSGAETRRLAIANVFKPSSEVGDQDELPTELAANQVRLDFTKGVPYVIDRPLVEVMLQAGYFSSVEDVEDDLTKTHGPLRITGFYVDSGISGQASKPKKHSEMLPIYRALFGMITLPLAAAVVATTLAAVYRLSGRYRAVPTEGEEEIQRSPGLE